MSDFKLSDAIYAGDSKAPDVTQDLEYQYEQWHRASLSHKFKKTRRNQTPKSVPDQHEQSMIRVQRPRSSSKLSIPSCSPSIFANQQQNFSESTNNASLKAEEEEPAISLPRFSLANEQPFQLFPIFLKKPTAPNQQKQNMIQRSSSISRSNSQQKTMQSPSLRFFVLEEKMAEVEEMKQKRIQQRMNDQKPLLQKNHTIPKINANSNTQRNTPKEPMMKTYDYYYSQMISHGNWSVIWDLNKIQNIPLILDRSDKYLVLTDKQENGKGEHRRIREWNDLDLITNTNFYCQIRNENKSTDEQVIQHADPANSLALIDPNITDFEHFHHPFFDVVSKNLLNEEMIVTCPPRIQANEGGSPFLKDLASLSGKTGNLFVIEHTSEFPAFIINVGMGSMMVTYWHKERENDIPSLTDADRNLKILEPTDTSPFIAELPRNKPVQALFCQLFKMPVYKHKQNNRDFILIKDQTSKKFYIRHFDAIYCAGMLEPREDVMTPSAKQTQKFQEEFMKAILINIFRGTVQFPKQRKKVQVNAIRKEYFPDATDNKLRKILKPCANFYREQGNGFWERQTNVNLDNQFQMLDITPEKVCSYQSMLVGKWRLREGGVNILSSSPRLYLQIKKLNGEMTKRVAEKIELELMKTPWAKTSSFNGAFVSQSIEMTNADGQLVYRKKSRRAKAENAELAQSKRQLAGTRADLRTLSLSALKEKLLALGVPMATILETPRWKQVDLLRQLATRQKHDDPSSIIAEYYARGPRNEFRASIEKYKQQYQQTFENNLNFISTTEDQVENEDFDDGNLLDDIGLEMMHNKNEEEEDIYENDVQEQEEQQAPPKFQSSGDPEELVPYGICTYPTRIKWEEYGFDPNNTPMRPVTKLIHISLTETGVAIHVDWKRSFLKRSEFKNRTSCVVTDTSAATQSFECKVLSDRKKQIQEKQRRRKQTLKSKSNKQGCLGYIPSHTFLLVHENSKGQYCFQLTPEVIEQIDEARKKYQNFNGSLSSLSSSSSYIPSSSSASSSFSSSALQSGSHHHHSTNKKKKRQPSSSSSEGNHQQSSSMNSSMTSSSSSMSSLNGAGNANKSTKRKRSRDQSNDSLSKLNRDIKAFINRESKGDFMEFFPSKQDEPEAPTLKMLLAKCEKDEYKTPNELLEDVTKFQTYYYIRGSNPTKKKVDEMYYKFKMAFSDKK